MNWETFFAEVPDFRLNRRKKHALLDILVITLLAVICGADDYEEIALYGQQKQVFLQTFLKLDNGIPSHDTFNRVFRFLDKKAFGACLHRWSKQIINELAPIMPQIEIDGKVLRATAKAGHKKSGLCVVSAWAGEQRLVLGQEKVATKSNEKTAIPALLEVLDLTGALVSIDAIACEIKNAELIVAGEGHYLLALKKNQARLFEQVTERMQQTKGGLLADEQVDFGSGRIETRRCYVETNLSLYDDLAAWPGCKSVVMIEARRDVNGQISEQTRYYLSDLALSAASFNRAVRHHWSIENQLHWHLDMTFHEDQQRVREGNGAENFATIRKLALQALHRVDDKESIKSRRKLAGWDNEYLLKVLTAI
jgi:predicted transposase YbfD/YdcC